MSEQVLTDLDFDSLGLHPSLSQGLRDAGFIRCTPIQALTLPTALQGKDLAGQAQTGTGKTAAFLVAVMNRLLTRPAHAERRGQDPRAVILAPTRELAIQIDKDAQAIGPHAGLKLVLVYGGVDYDKQKRLLQDDVDIIVATPGRLIDYVKQGVVNLRSVEVMVMDEADRMFDLGFIKDIRFLLRRMPGPKERQNLLFSATLSHRVLELAYEHMNEPEKMVVETESVTTSRVRQSIYFPASEEKLPLLLSLLSRMEASRTMIFVNTKIACERVARALERAHYRVGVLSGDVPQKKRESLLARFQRGELELLVATDVAARGLHIAAVSHVINYDLPFDAEDYVHRIGRTARLGADGDAISFACDEYAISLPDIEAYIEQKIPVVRIEPEMLIAVPRAPRPPASNAEGEPEEPFKSVIADAYADREPRHGKGGGRHSRPGKPGHRGERKPNRTEHKRPQPATQTRPNLPAPTPVATASEGGEVGTPVELRKRRRRRGGRNRNREGGVPVVEANQKVAQAVEVESPKLLQRIKAKLKSMISRLPLPRRR